MADVIRLLPDVVANQIAAGEVIQRPSSVVKELMENSVDAGADAIEVWVTDAGKTNIQVVDNGRGMSETDARLSFERHATSKIRTAADLFALHTMGFRGEALASIVAVAQVELKTRTKEDDLGVWMYLEASKLVEQKAVACKIGSSFSIKNLFFNVPARRRFLKSDATELNNIMTEFERVALIHPEIGFTFHRDETLVMDLRPSSFRKRITSLFGNNLDKQLLPVQVETSLIKIDGFVGNPESARTKGARQFFFVNHRYMKHQYFNRAVMAAFDKLIPSDKQVPYFLCLEVDPGKIDVNIHPTKTEIKFEDDQAIWKILLAAVKESLGRFNVAPSMDFTDENVLEIPVFNPTTPVASPQIEYDRSYTPFQDTPRTSSSRNYAPDRWEDLYASLKKTTSTAVNQVQEVVQPLFDEPKSEPTTEPVEKDTAVYFQYRGKYIFTTVRSGLMMIDQNRASLRIAYDRFMKQIKQHSVVVQGLLFPEILQVPVGKSVVFSEHLSEMATVGFDIESMGGGRFAVNGVPAGTEKQDILLLVQEVYELFINNAGTALDKIYHQVALTLARRNLLPNGQTLNNEEMKKLVDDLFLCEIPNYTPDGKLVLTIIGNEKIESLLH
ncbi:MAG: DNA mismatch repair endonuclease MutL [Bacteroidaceae bacterium]|nr:DNA mismatch repair endonuclease MutL [Bacteroidaceae bacterium]